MQIKRCLYMLVICFNSFFYACKSTERIYEHWKGENYYITLTPPNGVKIANNFFYDKTEITNVNWREYMYWTKEVFGENSTEYKSTFPDASVWVDSPSNHSCLKSYENFYLDDVVYDNYPVVGITQNQAINYSKWRSDRVMENILILNKKLEWDPVPDSETYFTIKGYFNGKYKNIKPDTNFLYYPSFRLPTTIEWQKAVKYSDSIYRIVCNDTVLVFRSDIAPCENNTIFVNAPTENVYTGCKSNKDSVIYNLRGNVSEWTSENEICVGGGWADKRQIILGQDTFHVNKPNAWTGFRNVCEWKKWTK